MNADLALLEALGLARAEGLTAVGRRLEEAHWIYDDEPSAKAIWQDALINIPVTQALMQGLHGRGPVRFPGAHHLLARHGFATLAETGRVRALLQVLNAAGVIAYSNKLQTVRILAPVPEAIAAVVRVVEPERPYSNVLALREVLRCPRSRNAPHI